MCLYLTSRGLPQHPSDIACACAVLQARKAAQQDWHCWLRWGGARGLALTPRLPQPPDLLSESGAEVELHTRITLLGNVPKAVQGSFWNAC